MKKEFFIKECEKINININDDQYNKFLDYYSFMDLYNKKINLTNIVKKEEVFIKHFFDSIVPENMISKNSKIIDIGSGAGFPGIPLKIIREDINITLLDSLNKRVVFLDKIIGKLGLNKINTVHARAEDHIKYKREAFDYCVSRAVAPLNTLLEYCLPYVKVGGYFIAYKSLKLEHEIKESNNAIKILGGRVEKIETYNLGLDDSERKILFIKKIDKTPGKFPRNKNLARKKPL